MNNGKSLDEIGIKYRTDKNSRCHNYLATYEFFFNPFKEKDIVLLEIGGFRGASLKMWEEFFPKAKIICIDIDPNVKNLENDRISVEIGDISSKHLLDSFKIKYPKINIIIDDASHRWDHQRIAFEELFQIVSPGGYYIVEDLHTSYMPYFSGQDRQPFIEYLKNRIDYNNLIRDYGTFQEAILNYENSTNPEIIKIEKQIDFMTFISKACIIKKRS
ncbi:class I SAM-dependent methyltransferase [Paenibacillus prosopidis]|uniref:Methyltransferase family protein n=1 Tax=Paenibacillus prosopidis TaxID=630520 RepID=A0A368W692_9BACL|nr:class I SAM-dependent methyltransferase [Paenibacillus prosopidis]RCW50862.1 hypothetical protein DFP97_10254 [Paenibacillus prosopidis]